MGTSTSYTGPTGVSPLLPPWADGSTGDAGDGNGTGDDGSSPEPRPQRLPIQPPVNWAAAKGNLTRWAHRTGGRTLRPAARSYVAASGGSRTAARSATSGRTATGRLGQFLAAGARGGFAAAAESLLGLRNLVGRDAQSVLAAVVDAIAPAGALREEAITRVAMIETLTEMFDHCDVDAGGITALDALNTDGVGQVIMRSVVNYVYIRFQQELVSRIEFGTTSERAANMLIAQAKEFFASVLRLDLAGLDVLAVDWHGPEGQHIVMRLFEAAYALLGGER